MRDLARRAGALAFVAGLVLAACGGGEDEPVVLNAQLGGDTTRSATNRNAFGLPTEGLSDDQRLDFEVGDSFFTQNWVTSPASTEARDGLGPRFNAQACSSCHGLDGRGFPPADAEDTSTLGLLLRLSVPGVSDDGGPLPEPSYGGQLQDRAVDGVDPEGVIELDWVTETRSHDDGATYELRRPDIDIVEASHGPLADDVMISPRLAPQVIGVGLLEAIPEQSIRDAADPDDADGDGISGRVNLVPDPRSGEELVGRFGWKANVGTVEAQIAGAFLGDIGITSPLFPDENCGRDDVVCADAPGGGDPEVPQDTFDRVVFYNRTLAVPAMRDPGSPQVRAGAEHFTVVGCAGCHTTTQTTGSADIDMLSDQTISPFTDLLLHDMGEGLADGRPDFGASG
ncbi:MAG: thiol oxidoreductase, partial [Microthrixaceae bacterium]|nr:thiol oxidoreductase [Microthrixaceae bacterium]